MIIDKIENIGKYTSLNPLFAEAVDFLKSHNLNALEIGKTELKGNDLRIIVEQTSSKTKEEARLEAHRTYIDIQVPLSDTEIMGYTPTPDCIPADAPTAQRTTSYSLKNPRKAT